MVGFYFLLVFLANINELRYDETFILYIMLIFFFVFILRSISLGVIFATCFSLLLFSQPVFPVSFDAVQNDDSLLFKVSSPRSLLSSLSMYRSCF